MQHHCAIGCQMPETTTPNQTVTIENPTDLAKLVTRAAVDRRPIVDYGLAHGGLGHPPPPEHVKLVQRASGTGVIEHYERDMTVRLAAGATIEQVQRSLAKHNQWLPIDADNDLTIGEVIQHNVYGPLRLGYGAIRDLLLGLRYIDGQGRDIHVGGRTVKNVAGYDLTRFMVGGLGELGIVYEATLRTYAIPPVTVVNDLTIENPALLDETLPKWLITDAAPAGLALDYQHDRWTIHVQYHGQRHGCNVQQHVLKSMLAHTAGIEQSRARENPLAEQLRQAVAERAWRRQVPAMIKIIVPPASTGAIGKSIVAAATSVESLKIQTMPAQGCLFVGATINGDDARQLDQSVGRIIAAMQGQRAWYARPDADQRIDPIAPRPTEWPMLIRLKRTMDPSGIFNPNRFLPVPENEA